MAVLPKSDAAGEPDAATEHIGMAWLSTIDDVTLISIFEHFENCYVSMPIVGTCRRIFITWTRNRRQIALGELERLQSWLDEEELRAVRPINRAIKHAIAIQISNYPRMSPSKDRDKNQHMQK